MTPPPKKDKHLPPSMFFKNGAYYWVEARGKKRKWHRLGTDLPDALAAYGRREAFNLQQMHDVFRRYQEEITPGKVNWKAETKSLHNLDYAFGEAPPRSIQPIHIYQFMDTRPPYIGNRELSLLSDVFKKAIRWGVVEENPCVKVQRNPEQPRDRYVTDEEFWSVWELAQPVLRLAMELALVLGLRPGDLLSLNRSHLTDDGILIKPSKTAKRTGKSLLFEWTDELEDLVARAKRVRPVASFYLLPNPRGQRYSDGGFRWAWVNVIVCAGVEARISTASRC